MRDLPSTKKSLGQHWLQDDTILDAMVACAGVTSADTVLEIGPGPGTLTTKLVQVAKQVVAVEFDEALAADLQARVYGALPDSALALASDGTITNLEVHTQDILGFDLTTLPQGYKLVANIPYYLTSKLLQTVCESPVHFSQGALLIQKEVAQRVCAPAGGLSLLAVSVQYYCEVGLGPLVPAALFSPPPKVDSQILMLNYRQQPLFPDVDTKQFFRIVKAGFSQRRKTLLNSLSGGLQLDRAATTVLLESAGIAPTTRAQALTLDQWYALYQAHTA